MKGAVLLTGRNNRFRRKAAPYILSCVAGAGASIAAMLAAAGVMYMLQLSEETSEIIALICFGTGCMVSGFVIGKIKHKNGLFSGIKTSLVLTALCLAASALSGGFDFSEWIIRTLTALFSGGIGGIMGVNRQERYNR